MKTDTDLQQDVIDELVWEPSIDAAAIGVAAEDGVVTLSGHVPSYAEKWTAEYAAKRVAGVRAIANEIAVRLPGASERSDSDIARAALHALAWDVWVPEERVSVTVSDGWVKLDGTVDTKHQKLAAERAVRTLTGVKSVTNLIQVTPTVQPADVTTKITGAFQRSAVLDARQIEAETHGGRVVLRGTVRTWNERETAEQAAWAAPGVAEVDNQIIVQPVTTCKDKLATYLRANHVPFETQHHRIAYTAQDVAASEHLPGQCFSLAMPSHRQEGRHHLGCQGLPAQIPGVGDRERLRQQLNGRRRCSRRRGVSGPSEPRHCVRVALLGAEDDVCCHTLDAGTGFPEGDAGIAVQALADRRRQVVVQGLAHQIVVERQAISGSVEQAGRDCSCQRG